MSESGFVDVEGGQLFYRRDGEGPPVVLIHGGLLDHRLFDTQVQALSQDHTFVRYDLRGYGRSSVPTDQPYRHCDDLIALLDALGFDDAVIGGESFGGTVSVDVALAYPERVRGLIFDAAGPIMGWEWVEGFVAASALKLARTEGVDAAKAAFMALPLFTSILEVPEAAACLREMLDDYSGWHLQNRDPAEWADPSAVERLGEIEVPALVVIGGRDVLDLRLMGDKLADDLPNAERHLLDHVGHAPNMEDPDTFNALALGFLDGLDT